jgi:hypothetical protein
MHQKQELGINRVEVDFWQLLEMAPVIQAKCQPATHERRNTIRKKRGIIILVVLADGREARGGGGRVNGTVSREFLLNVFLMNHLIPVP